MAPAGSCSRPDQAGGMARWALAAVGLHAAVLAGAAGASVKAPSPELLGFNVMTVADPVQTADEMRRPNPGVGDGMHGPSVSTNPRAATRRARPLTSVASPEVPVVAEGAATGEVEVGTNGEPAAGSSSASHASPGAPGAAATGLREGARRAVLAGAADPCRGLFPYAAAANSGAVAVEVSVAPDGGVSLQRIMTESPPGQGFGAAAAACTSRLRFVPASDGAGRAVAARSIVRLRFERRRS